MEPEEEEDWQLLLLIVGMNPSQNLLCPGNVAMTRNKRQSVAITKQ